MQTDKVGLPTIRSPPILIFRVIHSSGR
jgi:hypothetical protein